MKRFTQKFFLLAIGMLLSVGAYAQDAITHHWPEVRFTLCNADGNYVDMDGKTTQTAVWCTVPAWDAWLLKGNSASGHIRVQKYEKTGVNDEGEGIFKARLVTRYAVSNDNRLKVPGINATTFWVKINDTGDPVNMVGLQYKDVFGTSIGPDNITSYEVDIIETNYSSKIKDEYKIPVTMQHTKSKETYNIDEIGAYAFRQPSRGGTTNDNGSSNYVQATKIIIPKEIISIGRGAFFMNAHTTAFEFEADCPVEDILEFNFQDNTALQTISFPKSVKNLYGTVLGGCKALKKVTFVSENAPTLVPFTWSGVERKVFEGTTAASPTVPEKCIIEFPLKNANDYMVSAAGTFFKEEKFALSSPITMTSSGLMSCCSPVDFTVKQYNTADKSWVNTDLQAYYVNSDDVKETSVTLTDIDQDTKITAGEGVILGGNASTDYGLFFPYANSQPSSLNDLGNIDNCLRGVTEDQELTYDPDILWYILSGGKFRPVTKSGTIKANKAFLEWGGQTGTGTTDARELTISLPENTGINTHEVQLLQNDVWYTLQGIEVQQPQKGIFIKNGKKFVIK